ncbi:MAG: CDP-alcohol phosphatidyltransferase family protein, partial [Alphaproteobacteria bacterium]|nr:CDP-alcohol phosphatidyltransferase family protein [Alphaproteobacteria bacterium]
MNMIIFVNSLTAFRFVAAFAMIPAFMYEHFYLAFFLFAIAGITDFFDGILAKRYNATTKLGGVADHLADKLLVSITFILLAMFWPLWFISVPIILTIAR